MNLVEVHDLKVYFPVVAGILRHQIGAIKAVDGISFEVKSGEIFGVVGASGSGKSTMARALFKLIEPTHGKVFYKGEEVLNISQNRLLKLRKEVQYVFQDPYASLNSRKTIRESIGESLLYHHLVKNEEEQRQRVADILEKVGLEPKVMERYPHELSGGQQQRVCIGRAIAMMPQLIVFDEAVSSLDVSIQAQILNLLLKLKEEFKLSYLFIAHDLAVVRYLCDRVAVMHRGKIVEMRDTENLFDDPQADYTRLLLEAIPVDHPSLRR